MGNYGEFQQVQILRYFIAFINKMDNVGYVGGNEIGKGNKGSGKCTLGMSDSAEELVMKCIMMCLRCLFQGNRARNGEQMI